MHLLGRMLDFDPSRRISAEEALCHEFFAALESSAASELGNTHGHFPSWTPLSGAAATFNGNSASLLICHTLQSTRGSCCCDFQQRFLW